MNLPTLVECDRDEMPLKDGHIGGCRIDFALRPVDEDLAEVVIDLEQVCWSGDVIHNTVVQLVCGRREALEEPMAYAGFLLGQLEAKGEFAYTPVFRDPLIAKLAAHIRDRALELERWADD